MEKLCILRMCANKFITIASIRLALMAAIGTKRPVI